MLLSRIKALHVRSLSLTSRFFPASRPDISGLPLVRHLDIDGPIHDEETTMNMAHIIAAVSGSLTSLKVSIRVIPMLPPLPRLSSLNIVIDAKPAQFDPNNGFDVQDDGKKLVIMKHADALDIVVDRFVNLKQLRLIGVDPAYYHKFKHVDLFKLERFEVLPVAVFNPTSPAPPNNSFLDFAVTLTGHQLPNLMQIDGGILTESDEKQFVQTWPALTAQVKGIISNARNLSHFIRRLVSAHRHHVPLERLLELTEGYPQWFDSCISIINNPKLTDIEKTFLHEAIMTLTRHLILSDYLHGDFERVKSIIDLYAFRLRNPKLEVTMSLLDMLKEAFEAHRPAQKIWNAKVAVKYLKKLPVEASGMPHYSC
jgi:hypothetical protein